MSKRLTIEYVRGKVEERGWVMKDEEYVNAHTKMNLICPNGHQQSIRWSDFQQGVECRICAINKQADRQRMGIDFIEEQFTNKGCILRSTRYVNNRTKLDYICPNGHEHSISWHDFERGHGCPYCAGLAKPKIEYIRSRFEARKCTLVSTKYVNNKIKLDYICPNGHEHSIRWNDFQQGYGCPVCAGLMKPTIESIRKQFLDKHWVLKSKEYINNKTPLDYVCENGHSCSISWNNFQNGNGCPVCYNNRLSLERFGPNNSFWKGGISCGPYCDAWYDKDYKSDIRERDDYRCQNPHCSCNGGVLCLHHVDYNKTNCHPSNLILLCSSCHGMSNGNRDWHTLYFQTLMNKKYGYVYKENK